VNENVIEVHSSNNNEKDDYVISTLTYKQPRKYHKKLNHSSTNGVERTENDINSEFGEFFFLP
jgi:hypothetical protein